MLTDSLHSESLSSFKLPVKHWSDYTESITLKWSGAHPEVINEYSVMGSNIIALAGQKVELGLWFSTMPHS